VLAAEPADAGTGPDIGAVAVDEIRLTGGRVTLRDAAINPGTVFEVSLEKIDLTISDLAIDRRVSIELTTALDALPGGSLGFEGRVGPLVPPEGESFRFEGEVALDDIEFESEVATVEEDEFEFEDEGDSANTKLDLARAYIDMGDPEGAKSILEEVVKEGDDDQQAEARKLVDDLG